MKNNYGIPYQGSKAQIIKQFANIFPKAENFYDLFGGGFSVTHYLLKNRPNDFEQFYFNEIRPGVCELIQDAIAGKYNYDTFRPQWITREKFHSSNDAYTKCVWSFGNNWKTYLFGPQMENQKRSMHQAVIFNEFDDFMQNELSLSQLPEGLSTKERRLFLRRWVKKIKRNALEQLERFERLQQLEQLERFERLNFSSLDYRKVKIEPNSIIYCDIPYKNKGGYGRDFNHDEFFDWAASQKNPVFISEYEINDPRFEVVQEIETRTKMAQNSSKKTIERIFKCKT
jgi:site-specific DNA-adenine methylase